MKAHLVLLVAVSAIALMPGLAMADCHEAGQHAKGAISKDGTTAPMQAAEGMAKPQPDGGTTTNMENGQATAGGNAIAKDGGTAPLADKGGDTADAAVATSPADVAAQQEGEKIASAKAGEGCVN